MKSIILKYYPFLPLLLLCIFYVCKAIIFPIHDFANYYFSGRFLACGSFDFKMYFPYEFNKMISDLGNQNIFASYAPNTPFLAFLFLPFSLLSVTTAKLLFNCISIGLFLFSIYKLVVFYKINPKYLLLLPILFFVPIKNNLLFGQIYFLLFFLLAEGWIAYEKERWKSMAFFWGLAVLLKIFPILIIVFLLFRKQWKPMLFLIISCCLLLGICLFFTGIDIWVFYIREVLPKALNGEIATGFVDNYQSIFMFLKRLFLFENTENPNPFFYATNWFFAIVFAFKIGILTIGYFISRRNSNLLFAFSYWIFAMILISPYGSTYTFILLVFPILTLLKSEISNVKKFIICGFLFLINNLPLSQFINNIYPFSYLRLLLLLLLFGLFLVVLNQKINWKTMAFLSFVPMILVLIFKKEEVVKSTVLLENGPILVYDYEIKNYHEIKGKCLIGYFWDGQKKAILCKQHIQTAQPLGLNNNQVFYHDKQLTFDKSNKLKPVLIDNRTALYLSDYDRGIGFYTLRKIDLK